MPNPISTDEQAIRKLFADWSHATLAGQLNDLLGLMAEDVIFLVAGQPPMVGRAAFAQAFQSVIGRVRITPEGQIDELQISGDLAFVRSRLVVTVTPLAGGTAQRRSGPTLTILRKQTNGAWVIARDANLLTTEAETPRSGG